jgi:hypothetical protein
MLLGTPYEEGSGTDSLMSYKTLKGETLHGDLFIDCTGRTLSIDNANIKNDDRDNVRNPNPNPIRNPNPNPM